MHIDVKLLILMHVSKYVYLIVAVARRVDAEQYFYSIYSLFVNVKCKIKNIKIVS